MTTTEILLAVVGLWIFAIYVLCGVMGFSDYDHDELAEQLDEEFHKAIRGRE